MAGPGTSIRSRLRQARIAGPSRRTQHLAPAPPGPSQGEHREDQEHASVRMSTSSTHENRRWPRKRLNSRANFGSASFRLYIREVGLQQIC
jgi:hypothetical protein